MIKGKNIIFIICVIILGALIGGCGESKEDYEDDKTVDIVIPDIRENNDNVDIGEIEDVIDGGSYGYEYEDSDDIYEPVDEGQRSVNLTSRASGVDTAVLKYDNSQISFSFGSDIIWLTLDNYSDDSIYITRAYIDVVDYQPIQFGDYWVYRAGDGDTFDPVLNLYSEVDCSEQQYAAYKYTDLGDGNIDINFDPVFRNEIDPYDGVNINCEIVFKTTGIYDYNVNIEYEYNNEKKTAVVEGGKVLYDDIDEDTFEDLMDEYLNLFEN